MTDCKTKRLSRAALFVILTCFAAYSGAAVFKWQDPQGRTHYADRAQGAARSIAIDPGYHYSRVKKVYDGDTVLLQDGRKVRLLSINTPEIAHRNNIAESGGEAAKAWLESFLRGKKVRLQTDVEKQDKYGRHLAYLFTADGIHVNAELVERGLATLVVHPPNLLYVDTLLAAQHAAEAAGSGLWSDPAYAAKPADTLASDNSRGWQRITGRVAGIRRSRKYVYLVFSASFSARIAERDLPLFGDLERYIGKTVEVRGWLSRSKDRYVIALRHPSAIILAP
ncbi:MAG: thermonuclease family protein [Gammaproteobacteria bacterium]